MQPEEGRHVLQYAARPASPLAPPPRPPRLPARPPARPRRLRSVRARADHSYWSHDGFRVGPDGIARAVDGSNYAGQEAVMKDLGVPMLLEPADVLGSVGNAETKQSVMTYLGAIRNARIGGFNRTRTRRRNL